MRKKVYVSGPISLGDPQLNFNQAIEARDELIEAGFSPVVPHYSMLDRNGKPQNSNPIATHEQWIEIDLAQLNGCDAILRLPGASIGADKEVAFARRKNIPVFYVVFDLVEAFADDDEAFSCEAKPAASAKMASQAESASFAAFHALLHQMGDLFRAKNADYGADHDPFANVRASEQIGIPAWKGAWLRKDKVKRIDQFCIKGTLRNEGVLDSFIDLAVYCMIAHILFQETCKE